MKYLPLLVMAALLAACSTEDSAAPAGGPQIVSAIVEPKTVSAFGHELLRVKAAEPIFGGSPEITIAGNAVYDLTLESPTTVTFRWQGSPDATADIDVRAAGKSFRIADALTVKPIPHPAFERMFSIGASFGQGVINNSFGPDGQMHAPSAQVARAVGAYFPLPLTKQGYIPETHPADFEGTCSVQGSDQRLVAQLDHALEGFQAYTGRLQPWGLRIDPTIEVRNAAVGGSVIGGVVNGAITQEQKAVVLLEHLVYDPFVDWVGILQRPRQGSELDYVAERKPTLVMAVDLTGNDVLPALWGSMFDGSRIADDEYFRTNYRELFSRLGPDTWVFFADLPDITLIPDSRIRRRNLIARGHTPEEVDAGIQSVRDRVAELNAILKEESAKYPRAVVVPFSETLDRMYREGMVINGEEFTVDNFGGFISLDGLHLTKVGYAVLANLFLEHMNKALGTSIPPVDLDAVAEDDPLTPSKLAAYGLTKEKCPSD